jgi:hypothetical protein
MKRSAAWLLLGLAVGISATAVSLVLKRAPAPPAAPAAPAPAPSRELPFRASRRGPGELQPVEVRWPPIRPGDAHDWTVCAAEHRDYVADHLARPDFCLPAAGLSGRPLAVRWPQMVGFHLHLLDAEGVPLATVWPEEAAPEAAQAILPPEAALVLAVVPPSTNFYSTDEKGEPTGGVVLPPEVLSIALTAAPAEALPGGGELGGLGRYVLSPLSQNWFGLTLLGMRDVRSVHLRAAGVVLEPVVSAGVQYADGRVNWLYALPWLQDLTVEQAMARTVEIVAEGPGGTQTLATALPAKADVTCRPERPVSQATLTALVSGAAGARYHAALWVWPEPGDEEPPPIDRLVWEHAPAAEAQRLVSRTLEVSRERSWWEQVGVLTVRLVPEWPR